MLDLTDEQAQQFIDNMHEDDLRERRSIDRDEWGRRELVAIHLSGGAEYWPVNDLDDKEGYRQQAAALLHTLATHTGAQIADALETLGISQQFITDDNPLRQDDGV